MTQIIIRIFCKLCELFVDNIVFPMHVAAMPDQFACVPDQTTSTGVDLPVASVIPFCFSTPLNSFKLCPGSQIFLPSYFIQIELLCGISLPQPNTYVSITLCDGLCSAV